MLEQAIFSEDLENTIQREEILMVIEQVCHSEEQTEISKVEQTKNDKLLF